MLGDALSYPLNSDDRIATILIGGVLSALGVLILPVFVLQGYMVRVLRDAARGERSAPSFTDWGDLIVDGIKLFVVNIAYGLFAAIPALVSVFVLGLGSAAGGDSGAGTGPGMLAGAVGLVGLLVLLALGLALAYFLPAAMVNFAAEDSLGAAFDFSTIWTGAATSEYFVGWLLAVVVGVVLGSIGSLLSAVLVGFLLVFYTQVVSYYLFGRGFADGLSRKRRAVAETNV